MRRIGKISLAALFASGVLVGSAAADEFVYVGNADSNDISVFQMAKQDGALSLIETVPFAGVEKPGGSVPMAVSPDRRFLYAGIRSQPYMVLTFSIAPQTGKLTQIGKSELADSMASIDTDHSGKYLFGASYGGHKVSVNPIAKDGTVGAPSQVIPTGQNAHAIHPDPQNRRVFATNLGSDQVVAFKFDSETGQLTADQPASIAFPAKSGPRHLTFAPDGKFVYVVDELDGQVSSFSYDAVTGAWKNIDRQSALPDGFKDKIWAADLDITPDGRFLYATERTSSTIKIFGVDTGTGKLTAKESVPTETQPRDIKVDPSGSYLAAAGETSNSMTLYSIGKDGNLTKLKSYPVGKKPNWIEIVSLP